MSTNQTIRPKATTREYVEHYQQTDMAKPELARYCDGCGRLPCWCECEKDRMLSSIAKELGRIAAEMVGTDDVVEAACSPRYGFHDRDGVYHPAPGCNVILKGLEP